MDERNMSVRDYVEKYGYLKRGEKLSETREEDEIVLAGRIMSKRRSGKRLVFYEIKQYFQDVQIMCDMKDYRVREQDWNSEIKSLESEFEFYHSKLKKGDIIAVRGYPYRTKTGELTLAGRRVKLLAPCLHDFPEYGGIQNKEIRYRHRYVDLMVTPGVRNTFVARACIVGALRRYLDQRGFIEVETPILSQTAGGACARPFETVMRAQDASLYLRIAPELYLKQLVVGGMDRVYEIGKSFRNEGIDYTHNPEFTTCEFYEAYADYEKLFSTVQELFLSIVCHMNSTLRLNRASQFGTSPAEAPTHDEDSVVLVDVPAKGTHPPLERVRIDFRQPFKRVSVVEELERILKIRLPDVNDPKNSAFYRDVLKQCNLDCPPPQTTVRMFDRLIEHFIESQCVQPTYLCHFPTSMSPLAREHRTRPALAERFELFIARMELANAYTEMNSPFEQAKRLKNQVPDGESVKSDEEWFVRSLEWGLPPTAGCGLGIDRLVMLLTNKLSIKEVLLFPFMKDANANNEGKCQER
ncbi:uncharacterized protein LOC126323723 [Schistocerca gregaria]|uniref:uncharacterized protein LOC126323723 n=1 Tax=Schistocerca gregaria TaxID=7010 RepID=UPI00211F35C5|nr:uncharacterized protein LOC126323723 [Schistocerca gregaria]